MLRSNDLLQQLENAHFGHSTAEDKSNFDALLDDDVQLKNDALVYRKLWQGLDALKSQQQAQLFNQWEQDWKKSDEEELIEWFVAGELGEAATESIETAYNNNPEFAVKVDTHRSLKEGFTSLKSNEFRQKMASWASSKPTAKIRALRPRWQRPLAIAASLLLVVSISFSGWNIQQHSNANLLEKYASLSATTGTMGANSPNDEYLTAFKQAHQSLEGENYKQAITEFEALLQKPFPDNWSVDDKVYHGDNIEWSLILALLGNQQTNADFTQKLEKIATSKTHNYQTKAEGLKKDLGSFWRF